MTDKEKVIAGFEDSLANNGCGFMDGIGELFAVSGEDLQNAIALLKAQELCEDAISRKAAVEIADRYGLGHGCVLGHHTWIADQIAELIERLPTVMPKAQEPIEVRLHLCESCKKQYPDCEATKEGIVFGNGIGNDNIIGCSAYVNRWMPRNESRVLTIEEVRALKHNDVVWLEDKDKQDVIPGIVRGQYVHSKTTMTYTSFKVDFGHPVLGFGYDYMIRWRCWKSLPTKNQRKAEKWL